MSTLADLNLLAAARSGFGTRAAHLVSNGLNDPATASSFWWAIKLLPAPRREAMYALRAFYREVKDIADGDASRPLRLALLADWRREIALLYAGRPGKVPTRALAQAVQCYGLKCADFIAIIEGMEMATRGDLRPPSLATLDRYCECAPVAAGRLALRIFGDETAAGERVAAALGRALQLTDILCHLVEDADRGRLYLPSELLRARGIFATTPSWVLAQPGLGDVCRDLALLAASHYAAAAEAIAALPRRSARPTAAILGVYRALLGELVAGGWADLRAPVRIAIWRKLALVLGHGLAGR
jgi:phytoene synthase